MCLLTVGHGQDRPSSSREAQELNSQLFVYVLRSWPSVRRVSEGPSVWAYREASGEGGLEEPEA